MHFHATKSSILTKMGKFLLNHQNFAKFSAPSTPVSFTLASDSHFSAPLAPKSVSL